MTNRSFSASIKDFMAKLPAQKKAILAESVQDIMEIAQTPVANGGRMPVDDGHLINSVVTELNGSQIGAASNAEDLSGGASAANIALLVIQMEPGDTARIGWAAAHALPQHEGYALERQDGSVTNVEGKHWVDHAAAHWPETVAKNAKRLK